MRKTKIIATLGPASNSLEKISDLIMAGANVFRLNFSHGTQEQHQKTAALVRVAAANLGQEVKILADLQGPKIRIRNFSAGEAVICNGESFTLHADPQVMGDHHGVALDYPELLQDIACGDRLMLDDGKIQLQVEAIADDHALTTVIQGGILKDRKGINLLGGGLSAPALTEKDRQDLRVATEIAADFIAVSFPKSPADLIEAKCLTAQAGSKAQIIAKIERAEVVDTDANIIAMITEADGVMVARGDLAVEIGEARLPAAQKRILHLASAMNCPAITATQMLESMIHSPVPTRAEILDVANAVLDGSSALMLSAESASGAYPVEAVAMMNRIISGIEKDMLKYPEVLN
ncbi:pyruvate kinase [Plesiomonas shigelloides]|uniref:pyruvate kinase n=1 Tax=Plesiomonas shigelloides TaxID=703 RepID=UPI00387F1BE0